MEAESQKGQSVDSPPSSTADSCEISIKSLN